MSNNRILVNVVLVMKEVLSVANSMIGKTALPNFRSAANKRSEIMRIGALDELGTTFESDVLRGGKQEMDVVWHNDKGVDKIPSFASIVVEDFEKQSRAVFDLK